MAGDPMAGDAATVVKARAQVAQSRARIAETLDEIEERIVEKRSELREKLDVKKRVSEQVDAKPLVALAAAAGAGFLIGMLGRSRRRDDVDTEELRELLREAREDGGVAPIRVGRSHPSFWQEARAQLVGALTAALVGAVSERFRPHAEEPADAEPPRRRRRRPPRREYYDDYEYE